MERNRRGKKKNIAGLVFTGAMIACCCGLYLLSSREAEQEVAVVELLTLPTAAPGRAYPAEEIFLERAEGFGFSGERTALEGYAPNAGYSIAREDLEPAELILSLKDGGVRSFTLILSAAPHPGDVPEEPTPVELSLYEQRLARHELESMWREAAFGALISGLDILNELTYADRAGMCALLSEAESSGKNCEMKAAGFEAQVMVSERQGGQALLASVTLSE